MTELLNCDVCGKDIAIGEVHTYLSSTLEIFDDFTVALHPSQPTCCRCYPDLVAFGLAVPW